MGSTVVGDAIATEPTLKTPTTALLLFINFFNLGRGTTKMAGHTSTVITLKHYLFNEDQRERERLKKVNNEFA